MTLLQLKTSIFSGDGQSSRLADELVARLRADIPGARLIVRDLARNPVPHLSAERFQAFLAKPESRSAEQQAIVSIRTRLSKACAPIPSCSACRCTTSAFLRP
jgi:FMN-dependent NADH-azoreductase